MPLFSNALWLEYEDVLGRPVWTDETTPDERRVILAALAAAGRWTKIHFIWRPNLRDPADDHVIDLAVAGAARAVVTHNLRDLGAGELAWPNLPILTPAQCQEQLP
jgi:predicted nucleic acid-binding protein